MIVHTMTEKELHKEILADGKNALAFSERIQNKFDRKVLQTRNYPVLESHLYKSPMHNTWGVIFRADNRSQRGGKVNLILFAYYNSPNGIYAVMLIFENKKKPYLSIYTPHFFSRFAERAKIDLHGVDLMIRYFKYNTNYTFCGQEGQMMDKWEKEYVYGTTTEGVSLGLKLEGGTTFFKTYITHEMLKGEQVGRVGFAERYRKELYE